MSPLTRLCRRLEASLLLGSFCLSLAWGSFLSWGPRRMTPSDDRRRAVPEAADRDADGLPDAAEEALLSTYAPRPLLSVDEFCLPASIGWVRRRAGHLFGSHRLLGAIVGAALYEKVKAASLALYAFGHDTAARAGMILADTKFEFGTDAAGNLVLIDEVLTPDSSRYWPADAYRPDCSPPSYDKQFVRDHLLAVKWTQQPPAPALPAEVITRTRDKYLQALSNLLG